MPIYTYQSQSADTACQHCEAGFDVMQKLADEPLTVCPTCGGLIKKIITAVNLNSKTTSSPNSTLSEKNIAKNGFTQYRKVGQGQYEKTAGKGPETISADD